MRPKHIWETLLNKQKTYKQTNKQTGEEKQYTQHYLLAPHTHRLVSDQVVLNGWAPIILLDPVDLKSIACGLQLALQFRGTGLPYMGKIRTQWSATIATLSMLSSVSYPEPLMHVRRLSTAGLINLFQYSPTSLILPLLQEEDYIPLKPKPLWDYSISHY